MARENSIASRAATRPLKTLTDEELAALDEIGHHINFLTETIREPISSLSDLAMRELADRDHKAHLERLDAAERAYNQAKEM